MDASRNIVVLTPEEHTEMVYRTLQQKQQELDCKLKEIEEMTKELEKTRRS